MINPDTLRRMVQAEFRDGMDTVGEVHIDTVRQRVVYDVSGREDIDTTALIEAIVESAIQTERRRRTNGRRIAETVVTLDGERMAKSMLQMTLWEASQDINRREKLAAANRADLRGRHKLFHEAVRRVGERGLDMETTRLGAVLDEHDVEQYMAA